ncbi:MAG: transcriptional regulator [Deltaproteobacteria bacterium]|nr:transcriptional regulator [Deltaproteobacteria bacterium]
MKEQEKKQRTSGVSFGSHWLDVGNAQLWRGVQEVKLTGKALAVLQYFVEHAGQLATKDDLFAAAWPETVVSEATLVSCIQELRQALRDDAKKPRYIETVHRRGYRFVAAVAAPVLSAEVPVLSQQEEGAKQQPVDSGSEPSAPEQAVSSVLPAQAGIQALCSVYCGLSGFPLSRE